MNISNLIFFTFNIFRNSLLKLLLCRLLSVDDKLAVALRILSEISVDNERGFCRFFFCKIVL